MLTLQQNSNLPEPSTTSTYKVVADSEEFAIKLRIVNFTCFLLAYTPIWLHSVPRGPIYCGMGTGGYSFKFIYHRYDREE